MTLEEILAQVQMGGLSPEAAGKLIRQDGYKEMDYAKLDTGRKARTGFAEVIYCSNKADAHLLKIFERLYMEEGEVLGTRASQAQYELVKEKFPEVQYDPVSRILKIEKPDKIHEGKVAVCTAGTADIPVAEEAAQTAVECTGCFPGWRSFRTRIVLWLWLAWRVLLPVLWAVL